MPLKLNNLFKLAGKYLSIFGKEGGDNENLDNFKISFAPDIFLRMPRVLFMFVLSIITTFHRFRKMDLAL